MYTRRLAITTFSRISAASSSLFASHVHAGAACSHHSGPNRMKELQPTGPPAPTTPAALPSHKPLGGRYTALVPLQPRHSESLFQHLGGKHNDASWTYMFSSGFSGSEHCRETVQQWSESQDPLYFAIASSPDADASSDPAGVVSYLSIVSEHRRIEIGCIMLGDKLKRTRAATEAFYLMIKHAFEDLGYHRVEWKADNLNKPSLSAAVRLGFFHEGLFP